MKRLLVTAALLLAALLPASALADEAGEFDYGFGRGGKLVTPFDFRGPWSEAAVEAAVAPDGAITAGSRDTLLRYRPAGEPEPGFGEGGRVRVDLGPSLHFQLSDLAVDPEGRALAIGTATPSVPSAGRSQVAIVRYLADGRPDPAFGRGGVVLTRLGLRGAIGATRAALDSSGRLVVVAGTDGSFGECGHTRPRRDRAVARFLPDGGLDPAFGDGGVRGVGRLLTVEGLALAPDGDLVLAGSVARPCNQQPRLALLRLRSEGAPEYGFGPDGIRTMTGNVAAIAIDGSGRVVVLCRSRKTAKRDETVTKVVRLLPNGEYDPQFSGGWIAYWFKGPRYRWSDLAVDERERPLLIGTLVRTLPPGRGQAFHRWMMVMALRPSGRTETQFSFRGWLAITRFDGKSDATASEGIIDPDGRLLLAGTARRPGEAPRGGIALARYGLEFTATSPLAGGLRPRAFRGAPPSPSPPSAAARPGRPPRP